VEDEFFNLIGKIVSQLDRQRGLEHFKQYFANAAGVTSSWSSSASWAETDLHSCMTDAAANAPLFIEAFYDACQALEKKDIGVPDVSLMNSILARHNAGYEISPPNLLSKTPQTPIATLPTLPSLDEQASDVIQGSLKRSEEYLTANQWRQAVQEILWLLETVSTLFQDLPFGETTIQGKYFNKIAEELRRHNRGTTFDQALDWATTLHGYLSSPSGGGVRHGVDLKRGIIMQENDARLFCNLIRSYITYLLAEYERLKST